MVLYGAVIKYNVKPNDVAALHSVPPPPWLLALPLRQPVRMRGRLPARLHTGVESAPSCLLPHPIPVKFGRGGPQSESWTQFRARACLGRAGSCLVGAGSSGVMAEAASAHYGLDPVSHRPGSRSPES